MLRYPGFAATSPRAGGSARGQHAAATLEASALQHAGAAGLHGRSPLLRLQSDERLVALIRRGNHHAFEALVARYQSRLLAFCRHMLVLARGRRGRAAGGLRRRVQRDAGRRARDQRAPVAVPDRAQPLAQPPAPHAGGRDGLDGHPPVRGRPDDRRQGAQARGVPAPDRGRAGSAGDAAHRAAAARDRRALLRADRRGDGDHGPVGEVAARARARVAGRGRRGAAALLRGGAPGARRGRRGPASARAAPVRRHLRTCDRCTAFRKHLRQNNKALAALFPLGPLLLLKKAAASRTSARPPRPAAAAAAAARRGAAARAPRCRSASAPSPPRPPPAWPPPRSSPPAPSRSSTPPSRAPTRTPRSSRRSSPSTAAAAPRPPRRRPPPVAVASGAAADRAACTMVKANARRPRRRPRRPSRRHDGDRRRRPRRRPPPRTPTTPTAAPAAEAHGGDTTALPTDTLGTAEPGSGTYTPPPPDRRPPPPARCSPSSRRSRAPQPDRDPVADARAAARRPSAPPAADRRRRAGRRRSTADAAATPAASRRRRRRRPPRSVNPRAERHVGVGREQDHAALLVGGAEHEHLGAHRADLARREVDDRDDPAALELLAGVVGDLRARSAWCRAPRRSRSSASRRACAPPGSPRRRRSGRRACRRRGSGRSRWSRALRPEAEAAVGRLELAAGADVARLVGAAPGVASISSFTPSTRARDAAAGSSTSRPYRRGLAARAEDERVAGDAVDARLALLDRLEVREALLERVELARGLRRAARRRRRPCRRAAASGSTMNSSWPVALEVQHSPSPARARSIAVRVAQVERDRLLDDDARAVLGGRPAARAGRSRPRASSDQHARSRRSRGAGGRPASSSRSVGRWVGDEQADDSRRTLSCRC